MAQLGVNFAETFKPDSYYLSILLKYISTHRNKVSIAKISEDTGIPTGKSSGKVRPHIQYLKGMGMIIDENGWYKLTAFGRAVLANDRAMREPLTLLLAHLYLCDPNYGAIPYSVLFNSIIPNSVFSVSQLPSDSKIPESVLSLALSSYQDGAFFSKLHLFSEEGNGVFVFNPVHVRKEMIPGLGTFVVSQYHKLFPDSGHVSIYEFDEKTKLTKRLGIGHEALLQLLNRIASLGQIKTSALVNPPVIQVLADEEKCWKTIYDSLV